MKRLCYILFTLLSFQISTYGISKRTLGDNITSFLEQRFQFDKRVVHVEKIREKGNFLEITTSSALSFAPLSGDDIAELKENVAMWCLKRKNVTVKIYTNEKEIEEFLPNVCLEKNKYRNLYCLKNSTPLVKNTSLPYEITQGLQNKNIAVWGSHGYYYNQEQKRWKWQRARLLETVEDLFTSSFVQPFLVPMLENAGAYVMQPRERDIQTKEIIIDNDGSSFGTIEHHNKNKVWTKDSLGFKNVKESYIEKENPFIMGSHESIVAENDSSNLSSIYWIPNIHQSGKYAVYVSYQTVKNSVTDAHYTVYHANGEQHFSVNQKMGGGTWIYLGTFYFEKGNPSQKIELNNMSKHKDGIVTADAIKLGGGMGNIARRCVNDSIHDGEVSGYPRFMECSRYWLQWAGFPDSVYSKTNGSNDYTDDLNSRGRWVNYISGGSEVNPDVNGLHIPLHLGLALHTDAGKMSDNMVLGTLLIYTANNEGLNSQYPQGTSRYAARDYAYMIQDEIVKDVRASYAPEWMKRPIVNQSYCETRVPDIPTVILELLSHQNLADMRYGHDPRFKFLVSRAIYKAMLKYIHLQYGTPYVVQPLPINNFTTEFKGDSLRLSWKATIDTLEATANPNFYLVYTRKNKGGFDDGVRVSATELVLPINKDTIYDFYVVAGNDGGTSFPSEVLSAYKSSNEKGTALLINDFYRVCAPDSYGNDEISGFKENSYAVPYGNDFSYVGAQYEFRVKEPWVNDDEKPGYGASYADFENQIISGNKMDNVSVHGKAIAACNYSFVSCSVQSVTNIDNSYAFVDIIAGKQRQTSIGTVRKKIDFQVFSTALQKAIINYAQNGGNILVSGAYVISDLLNGQLSTDLDRAFAKEILHCNLRDGISSDHNSVSAVSGANVALPQNISFYNTPNEFHYFVEEVDGIEPYGLNTNIVARYAKHGAGAVCSYDGSWRTCVFGFPLECVEYKLTPIMKAVIKFFETKKEKKE